MNRRRMLILSGVGLTGLSTGCLDALNDNHSINQSVPSEITNWILDINIDIFDYVRLDQISEEPEINTSPENAVVTVTGVAQQNSSCHSIAAKPTYDSDANVLSVDIFGELNRDDDEICLSEVSAQSYRLVVTFDRGVPEQIEVEEGNWSSRPSATSE